MPCTVVALPAVRVETTKETARQRAGAMQAAKERVTTPSFRLQKHQREPRNALENAMFLRRVRAWLQGTARAMRSWRL